VMQIGHGFWTGHANAEIHCGNALAGLEPALYGKNEGIR
jgi:hypothetical protein